jgi:ubiquinone biosynthesis protein
MVPDSVRRDTQSRQGNDLAPPYPERSGSMTSTGAIPWPRTNALRDSLVLDASVRATRRSVAWRLCQLSFYFLLWAAGNGIDRLVGKSREDARQSAAKRMRSYIRKLGWTLIKVGQQASLRSDLLPEEYCDQLEELFDEAPAIPVSEAYRAIKEQTGKPWQETFREFNPEPVGSASIACVYRAVLHNGDEVAVKVRRPGIYKAFAVDLAALDRIAQFLEFTTFVQPGLLKSFMTELRTMLLEELNFRNEVRYQELFRRFLGRRKKLNVTAPRIYYELSGNDVIVSEFVTGIWVKEMMRKVSARDVEYLAELRSKDIDPRSVAKRLIRSQYYQFHECPFFHGDPHPGNIAVQPGGRIVMVDFGACGVFSARDRNLMLQMNYHYTRGDVAGMVRCVIGLMEPVARIDVDEFSKSLQDEWWKGYYCLLSKHADGSERTSFRLWVALLRAFRQFSVPMPLHMLRMVRATLLYDTVAARLHSKINVFKEFDKYHRGVARRTRIDIQESVIRQVLLGPDDSAYVTFRRVADVANILLYRAEKFLAEPDIGFEGLINKVYEFIGSVVQIFKTAITITVAAVVVGGVLFVCREAMSRVFDLKWAASWYWSDILRAIWPGDPAPDRMLQVVVLGWALLVLATMLSHGSRTLFHFRRKDDYPYQHRIG